MSSDFQPPALAADGQQCPTCGVPMAADQRYCVNCGERRGEARLDPLQQAQAAALAPAAVAGGPALAGADMAAVAGGPTPQSPADASPWYSLESLEFGSPRVVAAAVLGVLAAGIAVGVVAGPRASSTDAAGTPILVAGAPTATASGTTGDPAEASGTDTGSSLGSELPGDVGATGSDIVTTTETTVDATPVAETPESGSPSPGDGGGSTGGGGGGSSAPVSPAAVKRVWVVTLSGPSYDQLYGGAQAARTGPRARQAASSYLGGELRSQGTLLSGYRSVSNGGLANSIAIISGQQPNPDTQRNCPTFTPVKPGTVNKTNGLVKGAGCVFPAKAVTIPDQLTGAGKTWRGYFEDMANGPKDAATSCRRPDEGATDPYNAARPDDNYLTWRNPFVYFRSITESADCGTSVVGLDRLAPDLNTASETPDLSLVVPNACHDGSPGPCAPGQAGGMQAADEWLKLIIPSIMNSKAYADGGLVVITSDGAAGDPGEDGAAVGALLLSPLVAAGKTIPTRYDHYSLSKTISLFFAQQPLGKASGSSVKAFAKSVFSGASGD